MRQSLKICKGCDHKISHLSVSPALIFNFFLIQQSIKFPPISFKISILYSFHLQILHYHFIGDFTFYIFFYQFLNPWNHCLTCVLKQVFYYLEYFVYYLKFLGIKFCYYHKIFSLRFYLYKFLLPLYLK